MSRHYYHWGTTGHWLRWWLDVADTSEIEPHIVEQFRLILDSALVDSEIAELDIRKVTGWQLRKFFRRKLRVSLSKTWAIRIYNYSHFALVAAARVGVAKKYRKRFDFWWAVNGFVRLFDRVVAVLAIVAALFVGFAADRAHRENEDLVSSATSIMRDVGLGVVLATVEDYYYQYVAAPLSGGTPTTSANFDGSAEPTATPTSVPPAIANVYEWGAATAFSEVPAALVSPAADVVPGEGEFQPTLITVGGHSVIRVARIRPDAEHTSYFATVTWLDSKALAFQQLPGTVYPEGNYDHGTGMVPDALRPFYVAGLADAFLLADSQGGYILNGAVIKPMVAGKATLVTYTDGTMDIVQWGRDKLKGDLQVARQNLQLNVDGGVSQVHDENQYKWGWAWQGVGSGKNLVWRSAIGIRADGTFVFVIGDCLSAQSLADLMVRAGSVKAMPLDMNSGYANGFLYGPYAPTGKRLDPNIYRDANRFWIPSDRDFIAVYAKSP